jgi:hypothetical protein
MDRHYRRSVTLATANKFWKLSAPKVEKPTKSNVIPFQKVA